MSKIVILGSGKLNSSLNGYAKECSNISGRSRIVLLNSKKQLTYSGKFGVREEEGLLRFVPGDGWALNNLLGKIIFRKLSRELRQNPIHYTTFGLPVLRNNTGDLVTIHDLFFLNREDEAYRKNFNVSKILLDRFLKFENVISPSKYIRKSLMDYGFTGNIEVVYRPPPDTFFHIEDRNKLREELGLPVDKILILSVSSALKRKNLSVVNEAMKKLGDKYRLVRVGPPLGNSITYRDLSSEKLNLIYNACDILLFPTLNEGYGMPLIEAMATGLPSVVSDIEVMREIAENSAVYIEPSVEGCHSGILEALEKTEVLRKAGFKRSIEFSREKFKDNLLRIYQKVENLY
ncbi:glycosyltransferase, family [Thermoplasmatales archaeon]|nr:glycosyltransferase, family [Thermoplasmatales archaeon]